MRQLICSECGKYLGSVAPGSSLSKGLICTCTECTNKRKKRKKRESGGDAVDTLRSIFGRGFNDG